MFEKFFGPKSPEQIENAIIKIADKYFKNGVDAPAIHNAFNAIKKENETRGCDLTNNHLLNIVKKCALENSSIIDDSLMGGPEQVKNNIENEIKILREHLLDEEQKN